MQTNANANVAAIILNNDCRCRQPAVADVTSTTFPRGPEPLCKRCLDEEINGVYEDGHVIFDPLSKDDPNYTVTYR